MTPKVAVGIHMREVDMVLQVQYRNYTYDFVNGQTLNRLLAGKKILRFRRPSERRWIDVDRDPMRRSRRNYSGPERRRSRDNLKMVNSA